MIPMKTDPPAMNNLVRRTLVGIVFLVVMVFGLIWDRLIFGCLFLVILYFCLREYYEISLGGRFRAGSKLGILAGASAFVTVACVRFWDMDEALLLIPLGFLLIVPVAAVLFGDKENYPDVGIIYGGLLYIALPVALSPFVVMDGPVFDGWLLLSMFILVWMSDVGAYCVGSLIGKHRLFERVSPKKSWEGSIGGAVFSIASSFIFAHYYNFLSIGQWAGLAAVVVVFGTWGDLTESLMKRQLGIKDSGHILPGHGGLLDRFDSALMAIPAAVCYLFALTLF